jgi:hypothetical protein
MNMPFNQLSADAKFAYAVSETFKALHTSPEPVLGSASDNFTILDFVESNLRNADIVDYILHDNDFAHDLFVETIFALYNSFDLYKDPA